LIVKFKTVSLNLDHLILIEQPMMSRMLNIVFWPQGSMDYVKVIVEVVLKFHILSRFLDELKYMCLKALILCFGTSKRSLGDYPHCIRSNHTSDK